MKIKTISYEESRKEFFVNLIKHAENKIKYWERQKGYHCETDDNLAKAGAEIEYCQDALKALEKREAQIDPTDDDFGAVLNCAIRYSLGRQTYMPHLVMDFARPLLPYLSNRTLWCMARDIKEAETYGGYGSPVIDEPHWKAFLNEIENHINKTNIKQKEKIK